MRGKWDVPEYEMTRRIYTLVLVIILYEQKNKKKTTSVTAVSNKHKLIFLGF
jgi:hypothetical protein